MRSGLALAMSVGVTLAVATGCSSDTSNSSDESTPATVSPLPGNLYNQTNFAANNDKYEAKYVFPDLVNGWGVAIRPKGAGGHFWVGAGGYSFEFVGDVSKSPDEALRPIHQDGLTTVSVPNADSDSSDATIGKTTGVIFNPAPITSDVFAVRDQPVDVDGVQQQLTGSARFIFATDSGSISAWTEQTPDGQIVRRNGPAKEVFNGKDQGMAFFGIAIAPGNGETLLAADFGDDPQIRQFDKNWQLVPTQGYANPFATGEGGKAKPGDPAPFNVTTIGDRVFVTYAKTMEPEDAPGSGKFDAGEEDSFDKDQEAEAKDLPAKGKVAEFDASGKLVRVIEDEDRLNAPWGVAIAPEGFGPLSGKLLVANFAGAGRILAFDDSTGKFVDYVRDTDGNILAIEGIWGLLFGNGESLGDANALYFTAGPDEEKDGIFGVLRTKE
ncbi:TIGR03118 family protein [Antrihabitans sp. NCIMB 15449]|uniref:TIGR03118 family protein n=1 Tax=Antrihabitans spumae TaxID=3373370 RepID=A0ABW7JIB0_9NOCA